MLTRKHLPKIISNLFNNAIKYSSSYIHVTLEIDVYGENKCFHIYTKNDGIIVPDRNERRDI